MEVLLESWGRIAAVLRVENQIVQQINVWQAAPAGKEPPDHAESRNAAVTGRTERRSPDRRPAEAPVTLPWSQTAIPSASRLSPAPMLDRPRLLAFGGVVLAALAAWVALALLAAARPGSGLDWLSALCRGVALPGSAAVAGAMAVWALMSVAMMLPTAAPAIDIYVRLARRIEGHRVAHVAGFAGGYVLAWSVLSALAGAAQVLAGRELAVTAAALPQGWVAGGLLLLAGLYQLTPLKQACLTLCRNPLAFFMSHWREGVGGAVRMGVHHGAICIGCCWALMGLMFLSGAMNLAWMAALGLVMLLEKTAPRAAYLGRLIGAAMALAGAALIATDMI
jgi:predicted metal-binding membrane protein